MNIEVLENHHRAEQISGDVEQMRLVLGNIATSATEPTERVLQKRGYRVNHLIDGVVIDWLRIMVKGCGKNQATVDMRPVGDTDLTDLVNGYTGPVLLFNGQHMTIDDTKLHLAECTEKSIILSSYDLPQDQ